MRATLACALIALAAPALANEDPPTVVLVGATGDLASKYLWRALFDLRREGKVGTVIGAATRDKEKGMAKIKSIWADKLSCDDSDAACIADLEDFKATTEYVKLKKEPDYEAFGKILAQDTGHSGVLFYLSVSPDFYGTIASHINKYCRPNFAWLRVVVEKPFGRDYDSAALLTKALEGSLKEDEIYRIDHYLGKAGVRGIQQFRKANPMIEHLMNEMHVEKIDVVMQETTDVEGRTQFYERYGAIRDVMQNHLSEVVALLVSDLLEGKLQKGDKSPRTKVIEKIMDPAIAWIDEHKASFFGQYEGYKAHVTADRWEGQEGEDKAIMPTAAYVDFSLAQIDADRWRDIPITLFCAKAADKREAFAEITFRELEEDGVKPTLKFHFNPKARIEISSSLPKPNWPEGWKAVENEAEELEKGTTSAYLVAPEAPAYHVLLEAALNGEKEFFVGTEELMALWGIWSHLLHTLEHNLDGTPWGLKTYPKGSSREALKALSVTYNDEPLGHGVHHEDL